MATLSLLVVAPDVELRRSLEFALGAEGYSVTAVPDIASARAFADRFDCTILDAAAAGDPLVDVVGFCADAGPIVLLSDTAIPTLAGWIAGMVEKPQPLTAQVEAAMFLELGGRATTGARPQRPPARGRLHHASSGLGKREN